MQNIDTVKSLIDKNNRTKYEVLDLSNLGLKAIPDSVFSLRHLRTLSLTNNKITEIHPSIIELDKLEILGMNYNELSSLPHWIGKLKSVKSLDFWHNHIEVLPIELAELDQLEYLTVGFNQLKVYTK